MSGVPEPQLEAQAQPRPQIVYIAGYGRSGSTVLDIVLGNHPEVFGAGELNMFLPDLADDGSCSCGQPYDQCDEWKPVLGELRRTYLNLTDTSFVADVYRSESTSGLLASPPRRRADDRRAGNLWRRFYPLLAESTGARIIVDSSKTARFSSRRLRRLAKDASLDVKVIHLTRDPRAVAFSEQRRGNNDRLESGGGGSAFGGLLRPLVGWMVANLAVDAHRLRLADVPVLHIRYEDLASEPGTAITKISGFLDIDPQPLTDRIVSDAGFDPGHGVRGNRLRRGSADSSEEPPAIRLRYDAAWASGLDRPLRLVSLVSYPLARRYGYDVLRR